jgi:hypothetical protein
MEHSARAFVKAVAPGYLGLHIDLALCAATSIQLHEIHVYKVVGVAVHVLLKTIFEICKDQNEV